MPFSLRAVLFENFFLKLISLGIAVSLYVYVRGGRHETETAPVPVVYQGDPHGKVLVSPRVEVVTVSYSAPWSPFRRIDTTGVPPYVIDVSDGRNRDEAFKKEHFIGPNSRGDVTVDEVVPAFVTLTFEDRVEGEAPIGVEFTGTPERGFEPAGVATPSRVGVSGPVSAISRLKSIATAPVDVTGHAEAFEAITVLSTSPPLVTLRGVPKEVRVAVSFREVPVEKWYSGVPVVGEGTDWETGFDPESVSVKLTGPAKVIDALDGGSLRVVLSLKDEDKKGAGLYTRALAAATVRGLPEGRGVAVTSFSADAVKVRLGAEATDAGAGAPPAPPGPATASGAPPP